LSEKLQNVRRLEAQRNNLNAKVRLLREELQLLQEQGSHVGEVVKPMDKKKVLVKVSSKAWMRGVACPVGKAEFVWVDVAESCSTKEVEV